MTIRAIHTTQAPSAIGPYSQGVMAGGWFFSAGQVGLDPGTGQLVGPDAASQARQALSNLGAVLEAAGLGFGDVVRASVFLADLKDFAAVNEAYAEVFEEPYPARSTVQVAHLPLGARVEIDVIACRP